MWNSIIFHNFFIRNSDKSKPPRDLLHEVIEKWETKLNDKLFVSQNDKPNLADIVCVICFKNFGDNLNE